MTLHNDYDFQPSQQMVGLSHQDTLLVSDPIWMKPSCVPSLPTPIPPHNELAISTYITPIEDDISTVTPHLTTCSLPQTLQLQPAKVDK